MMKVFPSLDEKSRIINKGKTAERNEKKNKDTEWKYANSCSAITFKLALSTDVIKCGSSDWSQHSDKEARLTGLAVMVAPTLDSPLFNHC